MQSCTNWIILFWYHFFKITFCPIVNMNGFERCLFYYLFFLYILRNAGVLNWSIAVLQVYVITHTYCLYIYITYISIQYNPFCMKRSFFRGNYIFNKSLAVVTMARQNKVQEWSASPRDMDGKVCHEKTFWCFFSDKILNCVLLTFREDNNQFVIVSHPIIGWYPLGSFWFKSGAENRAGEKPTIEILYFLVI